MKGWSIVAALLLSLALVGSIACNPFGGTEPETTQQLVEVVRGDLAITVSGSGNIEVTREMELAFGIGGRVAKIYVAVNDEVSQGEVLARLETDALELALTQAKVAVTQAQVTVTEAEVAVTRAEVAVTQAQVAYTQAQATVTQAQATVAEAEVAITRAEMAVTQAQVAHTQAQAAHTQAQVAVQIAEYERDKAQKTYTLSDIKVARADIDVAQSDLDEALGKVSKYSPGSEGEAFWQKAIIQAQTRLDAAEDRLEAMLSGSDTAEVAIKKRQVEAAQQSLEAARQSLEATRQALELAKLSPELARQSLELAKQSLELAKLSPELARQSLEVTRQSLELAKLSPELARQSLELAKQSLEQAQKQLDKTTLVAPLAGVVARLYDVDEGDTISPATTILYLIDPSRMELKVQVDEIDIPEVKLGQRAIIEVDALPTLPLTGKVSSISLLPTVEAGVIVYDVKIDFALPEGVGLRAGMSATADIIINERSHVLLVPSRAINRDRQGNPLVEVMVNGQIKPRAVVTGISDGLQTEIVHGLNEGETVVIEKKVKP